MATKEHRRQAKGLIEALESRMHGGLAIAGNEILLARDFLRQSEFSPSSDYFNRLTQIQHRLGSRLQEPVVQGPATRMGKRNYGGSANGYWMQLQSAYDHIILSTCYDGKFNSQTGRIKISHRFNREGRIEFVELKFLQSLHPVLNGALRKLLTVKDYQSVRKDWNCTEAFVLEVLPRELVFLFTDIFRCERGDIFAWLINIGPRLLNDLVNELDDLDSVDGDRRASRNPEQLPLGALRDDEVALPIVQKAAMLEATVEVMEPKQVMVRY
jgi:hypothetical protein